MERREIIPISSPEKKPSGRIKTVGFDIDGTLVDTMYYSSDFFARYVEFELGISAKIASEYSIHTLGTPTHIQIQELYQENMEGQRLSEDVAIPLAELIDEQFADLPSQTFPEVEQVLEYLSKSGYNLFVSTSHTIEAANKKLTLTGIKDYFGFVTGKSLLRPEYTKGEPHFRAAASYFQIPYDQFLQTSVFIGDARKDIQSTVGAGMMALGRVGTLNKQEITEEGAFLALDNFDMLPQILPRL